MREFWVRMISVIGIAGILLEYNTILEARDKDDQIARLSARLEGLQNSGDSDASGGNYKDGTYTGEADGFGGKISVEIVVEENKIADISIVSADGEDGAYLAMAKDIIPAMIEAQSAEVDTVSGATFSSAGIRDASAKALEKAVE